MNEPEKFVAAIVKATKNGKLVSRIRMQKLAYLLQQLGCMQADDLSFSYHHYGPYSSDLDGALWFAGAFDLVHEERHHRISDGAAYSVFLLNEDQTDEIDPLPKNFGEVVNDLAEENITVLELAATAHWLSEIEKVEDWRDTIKRRKTWKTEDGRLDKALDLLRRLKLSPGKDN